MNLLFYTDSKVSPTKGGTEQATLTVANQLHNRYGCKCWAVHIFGDTTPDCSCFEAQLCLDRDKIKEQLGELINVKHIDAFLSESNYDLTQVANDIRQKYGLAFQIVHVLHFSPGGEGYYNTSMAGAKLAVKRSKGRGKLQALSILALHPYFAWKGLRWLSKKYKQAYIAADKVVVLSPKYPPKYRKFAHLEDETKFCVIPNALTLPTSLKKEDYDIAKKNIVLVVSRLDEIVKRISLVLKIWHKIYKEEWAKDWSLLIGGEGTFSGEYKDYVSKHNIKNVKFLGRVNPEQYYKEATIFMMTSRTEGFGLTLLEAMQNGVVPLAFDTFGALKDIITDGENGFVIPEKNIGLYCERTKRLMTDRKLCKKMGLKGIDSCSRFLPDTIGDMWWKLLQNKRMIIE